MGLATVGSDAAADPDEHVLREIARRFGMADRPDEVAEQAAMVGVVERFGVGSHACL